MHGVQKAASFICQVRVISRGLISPLYQLCNEIHTESDKSYFETVLKFSYLDKKSYLDMGFRFQSDQQQLK